MSHASISSFSCSSARRRALRDNGDVTLSAAFEAVWEDAAAEEASDEDARDAGCRAPHGGWTDGDVVVNAHDVAGLAGGSWAAYGLAHGLFEFEEGEVILSSREWEETKKFLHFMEEEKLLESFGQLAEGLDDRRKAAAAFKAVFDRHGRKALTVLRAVKARTDATLAGWPGGKTCTLGHAVIALAAERRATKAATIAAALTLGMRPYGLSRKAAANFLRHKAEKIAAIDEVTTLRVVAKSSTRKIHGRWMEAATSSVFNGQELVAMWGWEWSCGGADPHRSAYTHTKGESTPEVWEANKSLFAAAEAVAVDNQAVELTVTPEIRGWLKSLAA